MIGIDTNILVRYLVRDDLDQAAIASKIIEQAKDKNEAIFINRIVLCELVWVLESAYECPKASIISVLKQILSTKQFEIDNATVAWQAVDDFAGSKADFADCFIGRSNSEVGCKTTYSFDKGTKKLSGFTLES